MCTLTFLPTDDGYVVAMNRDELLTRGAAEPPKIDRLAGIRVVHPTDIVGGTWIGVNEFGTMWALLNWNLGSKSTKERSRGEVVMQVVEKQLPSAIEGLVSPDRLGGIDSFRLVGISASTREIHEYRWSGSEVSRITFPWNRNHWFSSGKSDELAAKSRGQSFDRASSVGELEGVEWIRRMHATHEPEPGAFSICVHREDAMTVSYTEIVVDKSDIRMLYRPGSPCQPSSPVEVRLGRRTQQQMFSRL